jgi:hypothetical protein
LGRIGSSQKKVDSLILVGMMTESADKIGTPALKIEQVAILCGVSVTRVRNWIEKNGLKVINASAGCQKVRQKDLVNFLIQYNMPIPKGILPVNAKKVLLVYSDKRGRKAGVEFLQALSEKIGRQSHCFTDIVTYGKGAEYKILTFVPDLILVDTMYAWEEALGVIRFTGSVGGMRAVALVRRNLAGAKRVQMFRSGAYAVIERKSGWKELLECLNTVFDSLGNTSD